MYQIGRWKKNIMEMESSVMARWLAGWLAFGLYSTLLTFQGMATDKRVLLTYWHCLYCHYECGWGTHTHIWYSDCYGTHCSGIQIVLALTWHSNCSGTNTVSVLKLFRTSNCSGTQIVLALRQTRTSAVSQHFSQPLPPPPPLPFSSSALCLGAQLREADRGR